jgi:hypothetical protein
VADSGHADGFRLQLPKMYSQPLTTSSGNSTTESSKYEVIDSGPDTRQWKNIASVTRRDLGALPPDPEHYEMADLGALGSVPLESDHDDSNAR